MYELRYEVETGRGDKVIQEAKCHDYEAAKAICDACDELGHRVLLNPICTDCVCLGKNCDGTINHVWTGCVRRKVRGS